jgi:hypothetical protein
LVVLYNLSDKEDHVIDSGNTNLDTIIKEFDASPGRDEYDTVKAVLPHCPHRVQVAFALYCAQSVEHLMTDERSLAALRAVEAYLKEGTEIPKEVVDGANVVAATNYTAVNAVQATVLYTANYAAYAAHTDIYAAHAAHYAAHAAANTARAAADAVAAATTPYETYNDTMRGYLNKLKELVVAEYAPSMAGDAAWLLGVVI